MPLPNQPTQMQPPMPEMEAPPEDLVVEDKFYIEGGDVTDEPPEEKDKKLDMDPITMAEFLRRISTDKDNRRYVDWQWFIYDNYVKGNHFVKYNDITQMVEAVKATNNRFAINKIWTTLRAVRGFVTKFDPKWYIYPENMSALAIKEAHAKQKVLDDRWVFGDLKPLTKQNVFQGLKYSIGILEIIWNAEHKDVGYQTLDPYDVYFGGPAYPNCTRVTKTVWRTLEEIEADPRYKTKVGDLSTSDAEFTSNWKQTLNDTNYGHQNKAEGDKGTIVYETHYIVNKPNSKKGKVNIATYTDTSFLRHVETNYQSLWDIFQLYKTDDNPGETYGEGWVKNLIPPQKLLDILESVTSEYHFMFAKGRYIVATNSGVKIINNENGTIIQHNPGRRPTIENAPSMAASVDNQINRVNVYIEDIGGQHDASLGRLPTGASAGVAIEALQEGDANNLKDLVDNYNMFLTKIAYNTLKMYARKLTTTKMIATDDKDKDGKPDFFAIIGQVAGENSPTTVTFKGKTIPVYMIKEDEKVRVSVDSWLAYTRDAREQRVYKHYTAGMISRKAALTALEYNDIDNIIGDAIKEEVVAKMVSEGLPEQEQPVNKAGGEAPLPPETETAGAMSEGSGIPMPM